MCQHLMISFWGYYRAMWGSKRVSPDSEYMILKVNDVLEIDYKCRGYCTIPYHGHPMGCPNFNNHEQCPPKVKLIKDVFDLNMDLFFIVEEFDLKEHVDRMRIKHPDWSEFQLKNLLYWQNGVRKDLKLKVKRFMEVYKVRFGDDLGYTLLPEAMGVMVINTTLKLGIPIEKTPVNKVFKIALVGYMKE